MRCLCHSDYNKLSCTVEKCVGPYLFVPLTSLKIRNLLTENPNLWHLILIHWERILQKLICMYAAKCGYCSHLVSTKYDVFGYVLFLMIMFYFLVFINLPKLICTVYQIRLKQGIPLTVSRAYWFLMKALILLICKENQLFYSRKTSFSIH